MSRPIVGAPTYSSAAVQRAFAALHNAIMYPDQPHYEDHQARRIVDIAMSRPEDLCEAVYQLIYGDQAEYAVALLEAAPAEDLQRTLPEHFAELLRVFDQDLRLAAMSVVTRRAQCGPPTPPAPTQSLVLRQARRYVQSRVEGPTLIRTPYNLEKMYQDEVVVRGIHVCDDCGTLYMWEHPMPEGKFSKTPDWPKCPEGTPGAPNWWEEACGLSLLRGAEDVIARGRKRRRRPPAMSPEQDLHNLLRRQSSPARAAKR
jgi:hypothetical protein